MKLHRIGVLMVSLMCCSAYVHASEPAGRDGDHKAGIGGDDDHRQRPGSGDEHGQGGGGGTANGAQNQASDGTVQAIVDYCSRVDFSHRSEYAKLGGLTLTNNGRKGDDAGYQQGYQSVSASLENVKPSTGLATCKAGIAQLITR
jgi:hypothetical protein